MSKFANCLARALVGIALVIGFGLAIAGCNNDDEAPPPKPGMGTWTTKASMPTVRCCFASSVASEIMYAIGGTDDVSRIKTVVAYDSTSNSWSSRTSMPTVRNDFFSGEVGGVIYAIGGYLPGSTNINEAYSVSGNSWSTKTAMPTARSDGTISVLNGIIYVIGGTNGLTDVVEAYDPVGNSWSTKAPVPTIRGAATSAVVNGIIYVIGGNDLVDTLNTVEAYDPVANSWTTKAPMPTPRWSPASGVVNGKIYVIGGCSSGVSSCPDAMGTVEEYDPASNSWRTLTSMPTPRGRMSAGVVNGRIIVAGGADSSGAPIDVVEEFTPPGS